MKLIPDILSRQSSESIDEDYVQSTVISNLRFPLIVLVVIFHLHGPEQFQNGKFDIYNNIASLYGADGIAKIAVPAFFLISGFLFFHNLKHLIDFFPSCALF